MGQAVDHMLYQRRHHTPNNINEGKTIYMTVELAMELLTSEGVYLTPEGKEHLVRILNGGEVTLAK